MSIFRILSGLGVAGITGVGVWFGLSTKQESNKIQAKMAKYKKTAQTVKEYISANRDLNDSGIKFLEPEDGKWEKWWNGAKKRDEDKLSVFFESAKNNWEKFRDECFEKMEERKEDLKDPSIGNYFRDMVGSQQYEKQKLFWEVCIPTFDF